MPDESNLATESNTSKKTGDEKTRDPREIDTYKDRTVDALVGWSMKKLDLDKSELRWRQFKFLFWGISMLALTCAYVIGWNNFKDMGKIKGDYVSVVGVNGEIGQGTDASIANLVPALEAAFKDPASKGVILSVNSPGGSPVQASTIHDAIIRLKKKYNKKVVVVGEDYIASGAYWISCAADKIYVNPNSVVGSIGVIYATFGFDKAIGRFGVERRMHTAGLHKGVGDLYTAEDPVAVKGLTTMLQEIHRRFIATVKEGRGDRLKPGGTDLFQGDAWSGEDALKFGLVDGLKSYSDVMTEEFGVEQAKGFGETSMFSNIMHKFGLEWIPRFSSELDEASSGRGRFE